MSSQQKQMRFFALLTVQRLRNLHILYANCLHYVFFAVYCKDEEWHRHVLHMAMTELKGRVQPETFVAFEMYAVQNRKVEDVAEFLNLSVSSVYTAKSRCISALKKIIKDLEEK